MPEVSILIPTHNRGPTLKGCIQSALAQTVDSIEVIIYDDGSDQNDGCKMVDGKPIKIGDTTDKVLRCFRGDKRIKYRYERENHGPARARNELLKMATGVYVMWLDSDDRSNPHRARLCLDAIQKYDQAYVRTAMTTFGGKEENTWKNPPLIVYRGGVSFATILFPREKAIDFDEAYDCCCEDMDWELRYAAAHGRSVHIPLTLYCVGRRTPNRLTMRYKDEKWEKRYWACKKRFEKRCERLSEKMKAEGKTKFPVTVPWDFLEPFLRSVYDKHYKTQASA